MSIPRYRVMESAEMISAFRRGANSRASADFPDAVGPVRMRALANGEGVTRCISIEVGLHGFVIRPESPHGRICNPSYESPPHGDSRKSYTRNVRVRPTGS